MCGILGTTTKNTPVHAGIKAIVHRGPDFDGIYVNEHIEIRHLLLAIRGGVQDSTQPVFTENSPWVLAFNGQLYNTSALRKTLGINAPRSEIDTILLYALISQYGWKFIEHIQGMFAIALYNKTENILKLYRDQSGQKNIYYTASPHGFSFCSEIKGLIALHPELQTIDELGLSLSTSIGYIPGHRTLIKNIYKLNPSEEVVYDLSQKQIERYTFVSKAENYYSETCRVEDVMSFVVTEHLQSNRDISINLSGGLDSSLIFHEAVQHGCTLDAFSTRFEINEGNYNTDADLAERLAKDYKQRFTPITITRASYLEHLVDSYKTIEEPNFNISLPIYYQTARAEGINGRGLRVVLSGDGGDEVFGGYPHYAKMQRIESFKKILGPTFVNLYKRLRDKKVIDYREVAEAFLAFRALSPNHQKSNVPIDTLKEYLKTVTDPLIKNYKMKNDEVYLLMLFDRFVWLANENFIRSDKIYMSQSMEMRCPLAYQPFRTYMDTHIKSSEYISAQQNKLFLRRLYEGKLPDYITKRKEKTGWRAPVAHWYDKAYKDKFLEIISAVEYSNSGIDWKSVKNSLERSERWPGKGIHLYLSLALLIDTFKLSK